MTKTSPSVANPERRRRPSATPRIRTKYTPGQLAELEKLFTLTQYPDTAVMVQMSRALGVCVDRVSVWFQNRRSKFKRQSRGGHVTWMRRQLYDSNHGNEAGKPQKSQHVISPPEVTHARVPPSHIETSIPNNPYYIDPRGYNVDPHVAANSSGYHGNTTPVTSRCHVNTSGSPGYHSNTTPVSSRYHSNASGPSRYHSNNTTPVTSRYHSNTTPVTPRYHNNTTPVTSRYSDNMAETTDQYDRLILAHLLNDVTAENYVVNGNRNSCAFSSPESDLNSSANVSSSTSPTSPQTPPGYLDLSNTSVDSSSESSQEYNVQYRSNCAMRGMSIHENYYFGNYGVNYDQNVADNYGFSSVL